MKRQIRFGVFETNSSSVHNLSVVDKEEFEKFKNDELRILYNEHLIDKNHEEFNDAETYEQYSEDEYLEYFKQEFTTKSGDVIVAFGKYGHD